jgi:GTPase SAR1 family protein
MKNKFVSQRLDSTKFDFLQKIIIIGDSGVGKSNILLRYSSGSFAENHMATIGLNYVFKVIPIDDIKIKLQIWDTAGQDKFKTITKNYYRNTQGVLVVFGVDCRDSYYSVCTNFIIKKSGWRIYLRLLMRRRVLCWLEIRMTWMGGGR